MDKKLKHFIRSERDHNGMDTSLRLENLFWAADLFKDDLADGEVVSIQIPCENDVLIERLNGETKRYVFHEEQQILFRQWNESKPTILLARVQKFTANIEMEHAALHYHIQLVGGEQVRGYIFLRCLESGKWQGGINRPVLASTLSRRNSCN